MSAGECAFVYRNKRTSMYDVCTPHGIPLCSPHAGPVPLLQLLLTVLRPNLSPDSTQSPRLAITMSRLAKLSQNGLHPLSGREPI